MSAREPSWWYSTGQEPIVAQALGPLGALYGAISARRMTQPPRYRAKIPVICVGNFTAGGTGKTPFVQMLIRLLRDAGHLPVVLSRGYGGRVTGPHWIDQAHDLASEVGDEPLLLAADAPVMVARDRAAGAAAIESASAARPRATVIVMDDGLQNPALAKDLTIAVVDAARGFGNGRCIPAGPMRAPLAAQLAAVQALVLNHGGGRGALAVSLEAGLRQYGGQTLSAQIAPAGALDWLRAQPVLAFAGIGVPQRFFATLAAAGADIRETALFPDHHAFTAADARRLLAAARAQQLQLVTTEKDTARLIGGTGVLAELAAASRSLPITLQLDAAGVATLTDLIAHHAPRRS